MKLRYFLAATAAVTAMTASAAFAAEPDTCNSKFGATPMRNNGYKVVLFKVIVARTILACAGGQA